MPLALEDSPKGACTYSLLDGDFSRVDFPVVTRVPVAPSVLKAIRDFHTNPTACIFGRKAVSESRTTFFLSSDDEGLRSLCSEGDLGGLLPGDPREEGGLVEGFGDGSGPEHKQWMHYFQKV